MFSRPDSPPPRQPSPDLVHIPLTPPRRHPAPVSHPSRQLATSRSCDRIHSERPPSGRSLSHSRSYEILRSRHDEEAATQRVPTPSPSRMRTRHVSFFPSPAATKLAPPVPPLPVYLRSDQDDSDTEKSSESSCEDHPHPQLMHTSSSSNGSLRQKSKAPPPEPLTRRRSRLVSLTRIKFFSWIGTTHYPSPQ
ncbi:hypothetical protein M378DRAFT_158598 [Amanita muscaria Koide BX008]|uniref:Uncharacterized protein n=1 Tax=Amanita muscaria (strain Koide BX008) TaxID=946122 RepID=A0A0C2SX92_AMAMK|nr:hypothetical protein M378DRAFT_158598 [Amanita muscaria Koide BX008]